MEDDEARVLLSEACLRVVVLSIFHFAASVWLTKAAGESAACADGAAGFAGRRQFCEAAAVKHNSRRGVLLSPAPTSLKAT